MRGFGGGISGRAYALMEVSLLEGFGFLHGGQCRGITGWFWFTWCDYVVGQCQDRLPGDYAFVSWSGVYLFYFKLWDFGEGCLMAWDYVVGGQGYTV